MLSFNCFYIISSVLIYAPVYATILSEIDDQFGAVLNASTSDAGTQMEVRFGQLQKVLDCILVTLETLFRYTFFKLIQLLNAPLPKTEHNGKLIIDSAVQFENALYCRYLHNGKLIIDSAVQFANA